VKQHCTIAHLIKVRRGGLAIKTFFVSTTIAVYVCMFLFKEIGSNWILNRSQMLGYKIDFKVILNV
jgi:hypothetical protein